jgi:UDP-GlcNAc:undecaprenyl-phosphate/decaprenyl-phosphate GlcNAc-1-phosphate transferase
MNNTYLIFVLSFFITVLSVPLVKFIAIKLDIYDQPGKAKIHKKKLPYLGGVAIFIGFFMSVLIGASLLLENSFQQTQIYIILTCAFILLFTGLLDDIHGLNAIPKLIFEFATVMLLFSIGLKISITSNLFFNMLILSVWVVFITNAFNNIDGLDGLASGVAIICSFFFLMIYSIMGSVVAVILCLALIGSCLAFLIFNFNPASIFMGDSGSLFIGFVLSVIPLIGFIRTENIIIASIVPFFILSFLIFDSTFVLIKRFINGQNLLSGDLQHTYNILFDKVKNTKKTVLFIYLICFILGSFAFLLAVFLR